MSNDREQLPVVGLLSFAYNRLSSAIFASVAEVEPELRPAHGNVLEQLSIEDGLRLTDIAKRSGVTPQSTGELVDQLEQIGLVVRRPDPGDRRAKRLHLTARGRRQARVAMETVWEQERDIEKLLGSRRYADLRRSLAKIVEVGESGAGGSGMLADD